MDLSTLKSQLEQEVAACLKNDNRTKKAALRVLRSLIANTPVDTSKAVSNWRVSLGSPNSDSIPAHFPGKAASTFGESGGATRLLGASIINKAVAGQDIYITNNLDYIKKLDARDGFVDKALAAGKLVSK